MKNKKEEFNILRKIQKYPSANQRKLAKEVGFSLGKLNYSLKALRNKGLIKISNFVIMISKGLFIDEDKQ